MLSFNYFFNAFAPEPSVQIHVLSKDNFVNYQFGTSELKNVEKLVEQTAQALKSYYIGMRMCIFVQCVKGSLSLKIKCAPWKVFEKSLKMVPSFV